MNYFIYKNTSSDEFSSLIVNKLPDIVRPSKNYDKITIEGRDGAIYRDLGYKDTERIMEISVKNYTQIDRILSWLTGEGYAIFSNEPDKKYYIRLYDAINVERFMRFGKADVKMICAPYKYLINEEYTTSYTVENKGTEISEPYMKITGSGETILHIDNKAVCTLKIEDFLEIDSESKECTRNGALKNRCMLGQFPELTPGSHTISFQGGNITECMTLVRSRFV